MNDATFERRTQAWLQSGPTDLPAGAHSQLVAAIDGIAQERQPIRMLRRDVSMSTLRLAAAAVVVVAVAGAGVWVRTSQPDVAGPRDASHVLFAFPETRTVLEQSGEPGPDRTTVELGRLPVGSAFVIAGSCIGGEPLAVNLLYASTDTAASPGSRTQPARDPHASVAVPCDGSVHHERITTMDQPRELAFDVVVSIPATTEWQVAIGEYVELGAAPTFAQMAPPDGWYVVMDAPVVLVASQTGIGIQTPPNATTIAVVVHCSGDPLELTVAGEVVRSNVECSDPNTATRIEVAAIPLGFDVIASTSGLTWVHLGAEADGQMGSIRPTAPALPEGYADIGFAEVDGQHLSIGRLGSNVQSAIFAPGAQTGAADGDFVAVAIRAESGVTRVELWSIDGAAAIRSLAEVPAGAVVFRTWVDAAHEQAYYGVSRADSSAAWHRVAFDGTEDTVIATAKDMVLADERLAGDGGTFLVEWCAASGPCERTVVNTGTGSVETLRIDGDRTCEIIDVIGDQLVARSAPTCIEPERGAITIQDLDGGERRALVGNAVRGEVVRTTAGDRFVYWQPGDERTTYHSVRLDGADPAVVATIEHPGTPELPAGLHRLPAGDWIILGAPFGDTPNNAGVSRAVPRLLNVLTGEVVELVNLPHSEPVAP
jgi:hypothetical protein